MDDLSSFFDFELGPPSITYHHIEDNPEKKTRPNKHYYHYDSEDPPEYKNHHYNTPPTKKQVVTPGTHYKSSTDKTFIEGEKQANESKPILNQAKIGQYQVSVVDADSPILSNLGLSKSDLERLAGYSKRTIRNASMVASDSTASATYAENPHPNYPSSGYSSPHSQNRQSYPPNYDSSSAPPYRGNYDERQHKPNDHYQPLDTPNSQGSYSQPPPSAHPPPQGSYDSKSYRAVQGASSHGPNGYNYPPPSYNQAPTSYNQPPQSYNQPSPSYAQPSSPYNNPPPSQASYNNPVQSPSPYSKIPPSAPYNSPSPQPSYSPQRSSNVPWRPASQTHVDWDDKPKKPENWHESGPYPPHPPPLSYTSTSSNSGTYYPKPSYGQTADKSGPRLAASYVKPDSTSKPSYSGSSSSNPSEYSSHKPSYYPSSSYSSKAPSRDGTVTYAASSHHHHPAPAKPGITIRFKAKAPAHGHSHSHGHGVSIPLSFSPLDVVKKLLPSLNPLNNKKVTIGITIENKKDHHIAEYHPY